MKTFTAALFMVMATTLCIHAKAQHLSPEKILAAGEEKVHVYRPAIASGQQLYLKMTYGSPRIENAKEVAKIKGATIACIDLVYSDHPRDANFDNLLRNRLKALQKVNPGLFKQENIRWRVVRQTGCTDRNSAGKLFHGLVITYRPAQTKKQMKKEADYLDSLFHPRDTKDAMEEKAVLKSMPKNDVMTEIEATGAPISSTGSFHSETRYIDPRTGKKVITHVYDSAYPGTGKITGEIPKMYFMPTYADDVVKKVLERNNWKNMLIVADVTGSMYPYTTQLFAWLKLVSMSEKVKRFVFFNDGDNTPDNRKVMGRTGGIYSGTPTTFDEVLKLATQTMCKGGGGDAPENNIEALIKGINDCPDADHVVLVADNWAPVKDLSMLSALKKPVKVIVCGGDLIINTDYLNLARATGGSVHTIEKDMTNLMSIHEGETLELNGQTFKIEKGKFLLVKRI